jgi:Flp pilus assembly pilin Flp
VRVIRLRSPVRASRGSSSVEYGLLIALIGAVLCIGIGASVKAMFLPAVNCLFVNLQGASDPHCADPPPASGGGGGGGGGVVTGTVTGTPVPTATPTPTPTSTPASTATPTP